ncbi:MAG TPA: 30S ribosomal protein S1 [Candidatus Megaira endosymbiont of Hartmannula sinica]|nr:30S ribosomal protein S1 [Candidatus Megaera endosymbiont of Hartmannula sinica]
MTNHSKEKFIPQLNDIDLSSDNDFSTMLKEIEEQTSIEEGKVAKGQVVGLEKDVVIVDVGLKNEARIPSSEFITVTNKELPQIGEIVDVFVERIESRKGTILSRQKALKEDIWKEIHKTFENKEKIEGTIFGRVKGGFTVDLGGIVAFLPGSQVDVRPIKDPENTIMNIKQPFEILNMDETTGNIIVSRRSIVEESRSGAKQEMIEKIKLDIENGNKVILDGVVKNIKNYGAFIDLGLIDGLLHVNDICWNRISHPSEVLSLGQEIKVQIVNFDKKTNRIYLGMKQLDNNPWDNIEDKIQLGKVVKGKVASIVDYGVFVTISNGIEGLVHSSEIAWGRNKQSALKTFVIGQEVTCKVININEKDYRISLSVKQCSENPISNFEKEHPVGSVIKAPIRNITDFGLFLEIGKNIDGMIHLSDISWTDQHPSIMKKFTVGDEIECKIINIDAQNEKVSLGIKQLTDDVFAKFIDDFSRDKQVKCTVTNVKHEGLEVVADDKIPTFIKKSELAMDRSEQNTSSYSKGDIVEAKVVYINKEDRKLSVSARALEEDTRKKIIKKHSSKGVSTNGSLGNIIDEKLGMNDSDK